MPDIEEIERSIRRLKAQVEANEQLLLKHAKRHDAQTAADPLTITSSAHARLHTLQSASDHSGIISSTQHGTIAAGDLHTEYATDTDLTTHAGAADPHTGYQKESEKGAASGYAALDASSIVEQDGIRARGLRETGGPTNLAMAAVANGEFLTRSGATIVGTAGGAGAMATDALWDAVGDFAYGSGANTGVKLAGNITTTRKFLAQTGDGAASAAPAWDAVQDYLVTFGLLKMLIGDANFSLDLDGSNPRFTFESGATLTWNRTTNQLDLTLTSGHVILDPVAAAILFYDSTETEVASALSHAALAFGPGNAALDIAMRRLGTDPPNFRVISADAASSRGMIMRTLRLTKGSTVIAPAGCASIQAVSTDQGWLANQLTTVQRDAVDTPLEGLWLYNTTTDHYEHYTGAAWKKHLTEDDPAAGLVETGGPTTLTMGAVVDGEYLIRDGATIVSATGGGGLSQAQVLARASLRG